MFSDYMKRGGIHGSKCAYIHLDLRTEAIFMIPTPSISDVETLKALNHLYGELGNSIDDKLSKWILAKLQQQIRYKTNNTTGLNVIGAQHSDEALAPAASRVAPTAADLASMVVNPRSRSTQGTPPGSRNGSSR